MILIRRRAYRTTISAFAAPPVAHRLSVHGPTFPIETASQIVQNTLDARSDVLHNNNGHNVDTYHSLHVQVAENTYNECNPPLFVITDFAYGHSTIVNTSLRRS